VIEAPLFTQLDRCVQGRVNDGPVFVTG